MGQGVVNPEDGDSYITSSIVEYQLGLRLHRFEI